MPFLFGYPITIGSFSGPASFVCADPSPNASKPLLTTAAPGTATSDAPMNLRRPLSKISLLMVYSLLIAASVVGQVRRTRAFARNRSSFLLENFPGDPDGAYRVRPARVERQVSDGLDQLFLRHAVFARLDEVRPELVWTVHRDQRGHRHQASVTLR